jgi:pimeloyl-ACP methyl ester carboxylesterase
MPVANIRGVDIHYEILGERGPFVALQPGGRRAGSGVRSLGEKIAEAGYRVIVYDRRNTGASSIAIEGESENDEWAEDLHALLVQVDALPAFIGGSSSGCRLAMILALRRPEDVRGLLLWRITGGAFAAERLTNQYYTSHIDAARQGGMAAGLRTRALERGHQAERGRTRQADGLRSAGLHRAHGAVAAKLP